MPIKRAFRTAKEATSGEERLWRERAARMTLDALGHTNLTVKPYDHNEAVRYARRWFRGMYIEAPEPDDPIGTFDAAGIIFDTVRRVTLENEPIIFEFEDEEVSAAS